MLSEVKGIPGLRQNTRFEWEQQRPNAPFPSRRLNSEKQFDSPDVNPPFFLFRFPTSFNLLLRRLLDRENGETLLKYFSDYL